MTELAKRGDTIEWSFPNEEKWGATYRGKTFQAEVCYITNEDEFDTHPNGEVDYGVYCEYGQDLIPHDKCKIIKRKEQ